MTKNKTGRKTLDVVNNDPRITEVFHDEDGYWLWLNAGWTCDPHGAHDGHEDTVSAIMAVYKRIRVCECDQCQGRSGYPSRAE